MSGIRQNLKNSVVVLEGKSAVFDEISVAAAKEHYALYYNELIELRKEEREKGQDEFLKT